MPTTIDTYGLKLDTSDAQSKLRSLTSDLGKLAGIFGAGFTVAGLVNVSKTFEDMRTSLKALYGTNSEANKVFSDIQQFAKTSVFSVADLTQTIIKLKAAGLDPTISQLRMFADVSSIATDSVGALQAITDLYARTTEGGLGLEDLNRLADRGIPVFKILGDQLGISRLEISKLGQTSEGAQLILKALEQGLIQTFGGASAERSKNLSQAMSNFGDSLSGLADIVGKTGLNQGLSNLINSAGALLESLRPLAALIGVALGGAFDFLAKHVEFAAGAIITFVAALSLATIAGMINGILKLSGAFGILNAVVGKNPLVKLALIAASVGAGLLFAKEAADQNADSIDKMNQELDKFGQGPGAKGLEEGTVGKSFENLKGKANALNEELKKFRIEMDYVAKKFADVNQQTIDAINLETSLIGKTEIEAKIERERADLIKRTKDQVRDLQEQRDKLTKDELKQGRGKIIDDTIKKIEEQAAIDQKRSEDATRRNYEESRKFSTGWGQAFNEYVNNATNAADQAKRIFQAVTSSMEDLLFNFFKTGKLGWQNFAQSIIDTLLKSQIQQIVAKVMAPAAAIGGVGGGGLFGGSIIPGILAGGGPAAMNRPYIVGERGPELFVPSSNGQMIPNSGLGGASNVTYNISAVDAMSFKQMLARDPSFLYAVSEQGRRTLPGVA